MRRPLALFAVFVLASAVPAGGDAKQEFKALEGSWAPVTGELGGKKLPDAFLKATKLTITGDKYKVQIGEDAETDHGTVKLDLSKKPRAMDITSKKDSENPKTILAIYELKGDTLTVCYDTTGKAYPEKFASPEGSKLFLVTYQ